MPQAVQNRHKTMFNFNREQRGKQFWDWFVKNSNKYESIFSEENDVSSLLEDLHAELQKVNQSLVFEFNKSDKGSTNEFIISTDGIKKNFPMVAKLIGQAPRLSNWKFTAFRPRKNGKIIGLENVEMDPDTVFFDYSWQRKLIGLHLFIKNYVDNDTYNQAAFLLLDDILGEYDAATKIGTINMEKLENSGNHTPLKDLPRVVDGKIERDASH